MCLFCILFFSWAGCSFLVLFGQCRVWLFLSKSALKNESTFVGHRKYFRWRLRVLSSVIASMFVFRGSFLPVYDNYWMSFLPDLVSPPSGCGFKIQFYRTAIIQFTPPMKTITFVFPFRIPFFPSPACTCAGAHALRAPHVYNIMRAKCKSSWNAPELLNNC